MDILIAMIVGTTFLIIILAALIIASAFSQKSKPMNGKSNGSENRSRRNSVSEDIKKIKAQIKGR